MEKRKPIRISTVVTADTKDLSFRIPVKIGNLDFKALIDSGAQGTFINRQLATRLGLPTRQLQKAIEALNVDGSENRTGKITEIAQLGLEVAGRIETIKFMIAGLGKEEIILGNPWLRRVNPDIDWEAGRLRFRKPMEQDIGTLGVTNSDRSINRNVTMDVGSQIMEVTTEVDERTVLNREEPGDYSEQKTNQGRALKAIVTDTIGEEWDSSEEWNSSDEELQETVDIYAIQRDIDSDHPGEWDASLWDDDTEWINIRAKTSFSQQIEHTSSLKSTKHATIEQLVPKQYLKYRRIFEKHTSERLPARKPWDHAINLKPDFEPKRGPIYPLSPKEQELQDEFLKENLRKGYIRPSTSSMAAPFFFIAKKEKEALRPTQDYRHLNSGTIKNAYPLPLITDLLRKLRGATIFMKLDICWGYNNICIKKGDEWKAAFITNRGLYEPLVMFFGLCNSPATFQALMDTIFEEAIQDGWLLVYLDDILIYSSDPDTHRQRTEWVLQKLQDNDLFLKPEKCQFDETSIEYLGLIIRENEIAMDPKKLAGIQQWPTPVTVKGIRQFVGFGNFYRKFIQHFADIARPLHKLTCKNQPFDWTNECEQAFRELKRRFATAPVLQMPDPTQPFTVEADASKWATGAVLKQQDLNGDWHPCGFISHAFTETERNYPIGDRELLAIIRALETWRHYLLGSPHPVVVHSDHKNLTYFRTPQKLNRRQARWSLILSQYDMQLLHIPGNKMTQADALSRRDDHIPEKDTDNEDITLLSDDIFIRIFDIDLRDQILAVTDKDEPVIQALKALKDKGSSTLKIAIQDWKINDDGLLFHKGRCYVPPNQELRRNIVEKYHSLTPAGHPGKYKTRELIQRDYWWPSMTTFINRYVEGCATCQQMKIDTHPIKPPLLPITSHATRPFSMVSIDFMTDLPMNDGIDSLMVVVDHGLTKGIILIPCTKEITALGTADAYLSNVYKRFGLPDIIISDRGPQFASHVFQELMKLLGIESRMSTAHHPQTDGETERVNQEVQAYLRIFCAYHQETWKQYLPTAEFCHNQRTHSTTGTAPFHLMMGYDPKAIPTAFEDTKVPAADQRLKELKEARIEALAAHDLARIKMQERVKKTNPHTFKKGDKVWLDARFLNRQYESRKLSPKKEGPFIISDVKGPLTYQLSLPDRWKIHPVFHITLLSPYRENTAHGKNFPEPPPDLIEGEHEYEVESILSARGKGKRRRYLIKWKGYPDSENTWEPEENLERSQDLLKTYKSRPSKRTKPNSTS